MRRRVLIHWGISSLFGWGVYGLNLALAWADDKVIDPVALLPIDRNQIVADPLRIYRLGRFFRESAALVQYVREHKGQIRFDIPLLVGLGDDLNVGASTPERSFEGEPTIGVAFFEKPQLSVAGIARGRALPLIVTGSTWSERILRSHGLTNVRTVLQGIDPAQFHPGPRMGVMGDRFTVFSGGKLELRKGQDIVVEAFARFARSHPDALLVSAWHSPWPQFARSLDATGRAAPLPFDAKGNLDTGAWASANGIAKEQFLDLGFVPHAFLPAVLREMDAALFTNRSESGTNLVAMECMACAVPTILSANTGHLDLVDEECCYPLLRQRGVADFGAGVGETPGWGDSETDEVVETLERLYRDRAEARRRAARGAEKLAAMSWARTAAAMKEVVLSIPAR